MIEPRRGWRLPAPGQPRSARRVLPSVDGVRRTEGPLPKDRCRAGGRVAPAGRLLATARWVQLGGARHQPFGRCQAPRHSAVTPHYRAWQRGTRCLAVLSIVRIDPPQLLHELLDLRLAEARSPAAGASWIVSQACPLAPRSLRPDRPRDEPAAAVRAHVLERNLGALNAERALVAADACLGLRCQVTIAALTVRSQLEHGRQPTGGSGVTAVGRAKHPGRNRARPGRSRRRRSPPGPGRAGRASGGCAPRASWP